MVRELQTIEKELQTLESQVEEIREKLETAYQEYVEELGDILKQQLIFSVYQVCTQEYPKGFLKLSLSEQQTLQKEIKELVVQAQENLKLGGDILQNLQDNMQLEYGESDNLENIFSGEVNTQQTTESEEMIEMRINAQTWQELLGKTPEETESENTEITPEQVINWSNLQEEAIALVLENVSSQANEILHKNHVLPPAFPKEMIDAALQTEGAGSISNRAPGVLHLMLEVERKNQSETTEENDVMQLTIIRLRVGELEFAAPTLNTKRRTLRSLNQQLQQLQEQYYRLSKERAIAQAELAWRSSWSQE